MRILLSLITLFFLFGAENGRAQLSGVKTINNTLPTGGANYQTFTDAFTALNTLGAAPGGVTFNVSAGQTFTENPPSLQVSGVSGGLILFQKSGSGANPILKPSAVGTTNVTVFLAKGDAVLRLEGADFVTFDAIDLRDHATAANNTTRYEYGLQLLRKNGTDGCQNIVFKNGVINLNKANRFTVGVYQSNLDAAGNSVAPTAASGLHKDNAFLSNTLSNIYSGFALSGASTPAWFDQNAQIGASGGGNTISDFGGLTGNAYGVYLLYQTNVKVGYNHINNNAGTTGGVYGVYAGAADNASLEVFYNQIQLVSNATTRPLYGIRNEAGENGTNNTVAIYNNDLTGFAHGLATTGDLYCISSNAAVKNLSIYNNNINALSYGGTGNLDGIRTEGEVGTEKIYGNTISNLTGNTAIQVNGVASLSGTGTTKHIYKNTTYSVTSGVTAVGLRHANGSSAFFYQNEVYRVKSLSAVGTNVRAIGLLSASGGTINFYNNFVSEIEAPNYDFTIALAGIGVTGGDAVNLYHNTVYLNATSSASNFGSAGVWASTQTGLDMRNNIIVNESTAGIGGTTVAYRRSNYILTNYNPDANNNCFYAGTGTNSYIFIDGVNNATTMAAYKAAVAPRDRNSFSEKPPFLNATAAPFNLRLQTGGVTQCESGATPLALVLDDFDANVRNASTPDVGASEGPFTAADQTGPIITYVPLANTTNTANRSLNNVTITDPSGVNVASGTKPRLYFRKTTDANIFSGNTSADNGWKFVEANNGASPFNFTIDYTLLFNSGGGAGFVTLNVDEIEYFVIAQDLTGIVNIGYNSAGFTTPPSSVSLSAAQFPVTGNVNVYPITDGLSGVISVPGALYPSLTNDGGIFQAINNSRLVGDLTIQIIGDMSGETGTHPLNQWAEAGAGGYNVKIVPASSSLKTITGNYPGGLIRLKDADRVTIDGGAQYLTFINTSTANASAVLQIISMKGEAQDPNLPTFDGAHEVTIRNCVFRAGTSQNNTYGVIARGKAIVTTNSDLGADNDNLLIENNKIENCAYGIYVRGTDTDFLQNLQILNNEVGDEQTSASVRLHGIEVHSATAALVAQNKIYNITATGPDEKAIGINLGDYMGGTTLSANLVYNISATNPVNSGAYGINVAGVDGNDNLTLVNNAVYNITAVGGGTSLANNPYGIRIVGGNGHKLYFNSVHLYGSFGNITSVDNGAALLITHVASGFDIRNNILANKTSGGTGTKCYALRVQTPLTASTINYNNYFISGSNGVLAYYGADKTTLLALQAATLDDANSLAFDPKFNADANLKLTPLSPLFAAPAFAQAIAGISVDLLGDSRVSPIRGAYENGGDFEPPIITYPLLTNTPTTANRILTDWATIVDNATGVDVSSGNKPRLYYKKSINANVFVGNTASDDGWKYVEASDAGSPFDFTIDYGLLFGGAANIGDQIQYFVTAQDLVSNVAINSGVPNVRPTSIDYTATNFPISGTVNSYFIGTVLSGTVTVPSVEFPSLTNDGGLFHKINGSLLAGDLTALITANLTAETGKHSLTQAGMNGFKLTISPSAATERLISTVSADTLIGIRGASGVTIDGAFGGTGRYLHFTSSTTDFPTFVLCNGASNDFIMNCIIEGANVSATNSGVFQLGTSSPPNGVRKNTVSNNIIRNNTLVTGFPNYLLFSYGSTNALNEENILSDNELFNFNNGAIFVGGGGRNGGLWQILRNKIYEPNGATAAQDVIEFTPGATSNGNRISDNLIGGTAGDGSGAAWNNTANATVRGLFINVGEAPATEITGNTVQNIQLSGTGATIFYGINVTGGNVNLRNNILRNVSLTSLTATSFFTGISVTGTQALLEDNLVGDLTTANSITVAGNTTHAAFSIATTLALTMDGNTASNITANRSTAATGQMLRGIVFTGTGTADMHDNTVKLLATNSSRSIVTNPAPNDVSLVGILINAATTNVTLSKNIITDLSNTTVSANAGVVGIGVVGASSGGKLKANRIKDLTLLSSGTGPIAAGVYITDGLWVSTNNQITLTNSPNTFNDLSLRGVWDGGTGASDLRFYHNSVYIGGSQSNGNLNSYTYLRSGASNAYIKNNAFINARTGVGTHFAIGKTATDAAGWGDLRSDYNLLVSPNANALAEIGTASHTFVSWKANSAPGLKVDQSSWSVPTGTTAITTLNAANLFANISSGDLSIRANQTDAWFVNGKGIAGAENGYADSDFSGETRGITYGYGVDIGSDEFTPSVTPHNLTAVPSLGNINTFTFAGRIVASIGWGNTGTVPNSISLRYFSGTNPPNPTPATAGYMNAYWLATVTTGSGYTYSMTLNYDDALMGSVSTEADLIMAKQDGSAPWYSYGDAPATLPLTTNTMIKNGLTSFSNFTGTDVFDPLPVEKLTLQATRNENDVVLSWTAFHESNAAYYSVERSTDGKNFNNIQTKQANNSGENTRVYQTTDEDARSQTAYYYYRVRLTDFDGAETYSNIVAVGGLFERFVFAAYPNPARDVLRINGANIPADARVEIYDALGRIRISAALDTMSLIDVQTLEAGVYFLSVWNGDVKLGVCKIIIVK